MHLQQRKIAAFAGYSTVFFFLQGLSRPFDPPQPLLDVGLLIASCTLAYFATCYAEFSIDHPVRAGARPGNISAAIFTLITLTWAVNLISINLFSHSATPHDIVNLTGITTSVVSEEVLFRLTLPLLVAYATPTRPNHWIAQSSSIFLYAASHIPQSPTAAIYYICFGIVFTLFFYRGGIISAVGAHLGYNFIVLRLGIDPNHPPTVALVIAAGLISIGVMYFPKKIQRPQKPSRRYTPKAPRAQARNGGLDAVRGAAIALVIFDNFFMFDWRLPSSLYWLPHAFDVVFGQLGLFLFCSALGSSFVLKKQRGVDEVANRKRRSKLIRLGVYNAVFIFKYDILIQFALVDWLLNISERISRRRQVVLSAIGGSLLLGITSLAAITGNGISGTETVTNFVLDPLSQVSEALLSESINLLLSPLYCSLAGLVVAFLASPWSKKQLRLWHGVTLLIISLSSGILSFITDCDAFRIIQLSLGAAASVIIVTVFTLNDWEIRTPFAQWLAVLGRSTMTAYLLTCAIMVYVGPVLSIRAGYFPIVALILLMALSMRVTIPLSTNPRSPENFIRLNG